VELEGLCVWADRVPALAMAHGWSVRPPTHSRWQTIPKPAPMGAAGGSRHDPPLGEHVRITPDDAGLEPVEGELVLARSNEIAARRKDETLGESVVHFPRAGFQWLRRSRGDPTKFELRGCASRDRAPRGPYRPISGVFRLSPTGKNAYDPPAADV